MSRFNDSLVDILSVFGTDLWKAEGIKAFPRGITPNVLPSEYLLITILLSGEPLNRASISGVVLIEIHTSILSIPIRSAVIADKLDTYLVHKSFKTGSGVTQFGVAAMEDRGIDQGHSERHKSMYSISFNHFGVTQ